MADSVLLVPKHDGVLLMLTVDGVRLVPNVDCAAGAQDQWCAARTQGRWCAAGAQGDPVCCWCPRSMGVLLVLRMPKAEGLLLPKLDGLLLTRLILYGGKNIDVPTRSVAGTGCALRQVKPRQPRSSSLVTREQ